ncbi:TonB-dependent receptor [Thauera sp. CAU 1555]|uniref:TonB-dependent receptor n=1 Tax=Thauera sedimentorum TaxID=2767595 RepID=A0ABR9BCD0_9RHOO|nr:TonB-dependent receptor [Thauera sedimentorum]MBC9072958.1 TonB-dependent receptor [Thauera sedimentorum]MBD8503877.1 TonB-dependent receptor [Thauera sedimentorum]
MNRRRTGHGQARIALLTLGTLAASAQAETPLEGDLFFSDLPIVASVSRLPQRQADAPSSVTVIDRATIRASGARALSDLFRLVPGFQTFAASDTAARVNYHGITDDNDYSPRVQVLVDGRSLHSPLFRGGMNWALVPVALEDIERIEVVRGSNTTSYGTNAFLGVINIITVDPALVRGVSVSANNGSQGVRDYTLRTGGPLGELGNFRLTYQRVGDDGLDPHTDVITEAIPDWQSGSRTDLLDLKAHLQLGVEDALELNFGHIRGQMVNGRLDTEKIAGIEVVKPGVSKPSDPIRDFDQSSTWLQMRWLRTFSDTADFSLRYTYSEDRASDEYIHPDREPAYQKVNEVGDRGTRHEVEAIHTFLPLADTRLVWGGSWRHDTLRSDTVLRGMGEVSRDVGRVFANVEWKPYEWFTGNAGISYEDDSLAGSHVAPRGSLSFHLTPENTVRIGYARAWRTAGTLDYRANQFYVRSNGSARSDWQGNPDLPAERLDSWELAYLGDWRDWRMSLDVRHFREKLSDRLMHKIRTGEIPAGLSASPYTVQDVQDIRISGYEYQLKWQPFEGTRLAFAQADIRIESENTANGARLAANEDSNYNGAFERYVALAEESAPRRSSSLLLMQELPYGIDLSVARYWVREMKWTRNTEVGKYNRTDLRIAHPFKLGPQRGELAYTVQSLDGAHHEQRLQRRVDRRHWVSLRLDF